ncbi:copper fist DNA binding domain-containing protein [Mucor mucedo]|uniref:copper fist DNA binding domain-containing protein n=1 Tax=Mucor mucedo TaxID=29922 RepID=UPI0022209A79|nr:copper fist DNA binding domain-containing protein [Mucor mucedo]KAI7894402.1 copper fist DNA binding domain-containing protein [Mucor mucedo]
MVFLINGVKHACAACIRGHRVKKCNHTDRPMIPLVKRGRQVSQCTHCRDLRQTNKSHVKCTCAIASSPNPINGCLCEVLLTCTCVAAHLQDVQEDGSSAYSSSPSTSCCSSSPQISETLGTPVIDADLTNNITLFTNQADQQINSSHNFISNNDADVSELLSFLQNDLDNYLSPSSRY